MIGIDFRRFPFTVRLAEVKIKCFGREFPKLINNSSS